MEEPQHEQRIDHKDRWEIELPIESIQPLLPREGAQEASHQSQRNFL
jgi:hypothetical protein